MAKIHIAVDRANAGTAFDIAEKYWDARQAGQPFSEFAAQEVADRAMERYQGHIRAGLARAGVVLGDDEKLDSAALLRIIGERTGLEIASLTPEAVTSAVQGQISARLSSVLGLEVSGIESGDELKAALLNAAKTAVQSGRANALISGTMIKKIRALKAWKQAGLDPLERSRFLSRVAQKKYRRSHKEVWAGSPAANNGGDGL